MAEHDEEICLRIQILNAQHQPLGGTVDIACKPRDEREAVYIHAASAAQEIDVRGLRRDCAEPYEVTVTPTGSTQSMTLKVTVPTRGSAALQFVFATGQASSNTLSGTLVFDNGLPAPGIATRAYSVGFAGQDTLLGQVTTGADGSYSISYAAPASGAANLQVRVLDTSGNEVTLSNTKYNAATQETLNLVAPSTVQPLAPEFQRLASDMQQNIGGVANLAQAQENAAQQDLTLLNQSTNWDARLAALGALSAQHAQTTGIDQEALYAMFRLGLPTDPGTLATMPAATVQQALTTATSSAIAGLSNGQVTAAVAAFNNFASKSQLAATTPGGVSNFASMAAAKLTDTQLQTAFTGLYIGNPASADFWDQAASLGIGADTLSALKVQGKFLYLTFNNVALANALQSTVGTSNSLSQLADKDYDVSDTWQTTLQSVATNTPNATLDSLIPSVYTGATTQDRLAAYTGDLARKVRISFPTQVAARMIERNQLAVSAPTAAPAVAFLRSAADLGYSLGRTPLNAFLAKSAGQLPALDADSLDTVKTLHRLYQITPSTESLQAALTAGFTSARQIASMDQDDFLNKYGSVFPPYEAGLIYGRAQTVSSVTFNICSSAILMDTAPPVYSLSASSTQKQAAKNSLIQQFPSIASLFGNLDYCECQDCSSVLSPAAYFVDVLEFLGPSNPTKGVVGSAPNATGFTPLDVLIGGTNSSSVVLPGRRPDLGALPLTCENTNTSMPYIDLVNEILEYYIANAHLDTSLAYDTGTATTAELTAEPQNILPSVYTNNLRQALFPLNLPFDLWIATVRGFLGYFKTQLAQVLDTLRPLDALELLTDPSNFPYYRAQIFAESLGLSPSDYGVLTGTATALTPVTANWFMLYGYPSAAAALSGNATLDPLNSAENLAQVLGLTYQQVTDLLETSFINPGLYPLIYQFQRLGIEMSDAFSYTGQTGFPALSATDQTAFEAQLNAITARYKALNPATSFDAITWLKGLLPAGYSSKVLVLADPDSGCNFGATTLQYADNATAATPFDFVRTNLFVRLWQKLGWTMGEVDRALQAFFPTIPQAWGDAGFDGAYSSAWQTALVYLAHLDALNTQLQPAMGRDALLPLWANLPVQGPNPPYGQLFLTASVLNNDWAFDDPAGSFPVPVADLTAASLQTFSAHLPSIQGALGLASADIDAIFADPGVAADMVTVAGVSVPAFTLNNLSICYRYSTLAKCLNLSATDTDVEDLIDLKQMSGLNPFAPVSGSPITAIAQDVLFNTTLQFVKDAQAIQASGFSVEDLQYLLRHQFDPVGKYQVDQNALLTLLQQTANGLAQIQSQNALPANLLTMPETLLDQILSGLIPTAILKSLFALLTNAQDMTATLTGVTPAIDPTPFAAETELSFSYVPLTQTQTVTYTGLLLDWKKAELLTINSSAEFTQLLNQLQQAGTTALAQNFGNILSAWASLVEYEAAVETGATPALPVDELTATDPALSLSYDAVGQLQWAGYRGVLTDTNKAALAAVIMPSPAQATLLTAILADLQAQSLPAYQALASSLLAMLVNGQTFEATATGVTTANQVDGAAFASTVAAALQNGTVTGPVPPIQFSYDAGSTTQTITVQGILTDALRGQIVGLATMSATAAGLLQSVRNTMVALFESLATGLVTVAAIDLDISVAPFLGLNATQSQRQAKAELIQVFLPLESQKLSLDFALQTLSSNLSSDPSLTQALVTDTALLSDPSNPGKSLQQSFLAIGQPGVSASYFAADGTLLASGIAATADTADPTNPVTNVASCQFTGYLQVPTDGPYRFFAELGNAGATALLVLTAPPNSQLLASPIIPDTVPAAADHSEISQFVNLQGGVFYQFAFTLAKLGANGGSLLIQSENMPKGPLSQVALCPQTAANSFLASYTLLSKALQILETTGIDEREIGYMIANATLFSNLRLSSLPTQPSDANMVNLFAQMLALIDYADLRKNPARGTDGLIDVFKGVGITFTEGPGSQASNTNPLTPWATLAALFRRNVADVRAIAEYFGLIQNVVTGSGSSAIQNVTAIGDFGDNRGIRRIWQALQLIQILGIPVSAATASTMIASLAPLASAPTPDKIATNLKNAVKAQYTLNQWLPIAQSVFDPLRQMKRDALVSFLVNALDFENENQLFEYFLVDPGMEPVVQTSRLRLAMSSLQTFVQRCLLNLENGNATTPAVNISPSAIDANVWSWMKRYRVWQANREIFLYPENWMEPELRTGMTDLFQTLESDLLQGDVTDDLASQAFLDYLTGLEQRARLDVVSCYLDQNLTSAGNSTLHVLARTYGHPHKYFYRTYTTGIWAAWQSVTPDIDGDHIALAVWKGRLNVFWVTFIVQTQAPPNPPAGGTTVTSLKFGDMANQILAAKSTKVVQLQLHWCEYYQGKWSKRISSDVNKYGPIAVDDTFDASTVRIWISKDGDESVGEGAVTVHLDFPQDIVIDPLYTREERLYASRTRATAHSGEMYRGPVLHPNYSFRVTSKNCDLVLTPDFLSVEPMNPYDATTVDATLFTGSGSLSATFANTFTTTGSSTTSSTPTTEQILQTVNSFALLPCSNPVVPSPFLTTTEPDYVQAGSLVSPFFYNDMHDVSTTDEMTFYVQPNLTETTVTEWTGWAVVYPGVNQAVANGQYLGDLPVVAQVPAAGPRVPPVVDPVYSVYALANTTDWLTSPATTVLYNGALVGQTGGLNYASVPAVVTGKPTAPSNPAPVGRTSSLSAVFGKHGLAANEIRKLVNSLGALSKRPAKN